MKVDKRAFLMVALTADEKVLRLVAMKVDEKDGTMVEMLETSEVDLTAYSMVEYWAIERAVSLDAM